MWAEKANPAQIDTLDKAKYLTAELMQNSLSVSSRISTSLDTNSVTISE